MLYSKLYFLRTLSYYLHYNEHFFCRKYMSVVSILHSYNGFKIWLSWNVKNNRFMEPSIGLYGPVGLYLCFWIKFCQLVQWTDSGPILVFSIFSTLILCYVKALVRCFFIYFKTLRSVYSGIENVIKAQFFKTLEGFFPSQ
jgi:hypothetical protein